MFLGSTSVSPGNSWTALNAAQASVLVAVLALISAWGAAAITNWRRNKVAEQAIDDPSIQVIRKDHVDQVKVIEETTMAEIAKESLSFLQEMLVQSQKTESELRATLAEVEKERDKLTRTVEVLQSQLERLTRLNEELTIEVARLRGMLDGREGRPN